MKSASALHRGQVPDTGFTASYSVGRLHLVLSAIEGTNQAEGSDIIQHLARLILAKEMGSLGEFEQAVAQAMKEQNVSFHVSVAAAYQNEAVVYVKTIGTGAIFLRRNNELAQIIGEDKSASGYLRENDTLILTDIHSVKSITVEGLKKASSRMTVEEMATFDGNAPGTIALFVHIAVETRPTTPQKNIITIVCVSLIVAAFVWSVFLGYRRRATAQIQKQIQTSQQIIEQKLRQAQDIAFLNRARSQTLIKEAKTELQNLKNSIPASRVKELVVLEQVLAKREQEITNREEKKAEEFFDLTVDSKDAKGTRFSLHEGMLAILNPEGGKIYLLSLEKKSLDKVDVSRVTNDTLIAIYNDVVYLISKSEGIVQIQDGKAKKVVEKDPEWGNLASVDVYNGNIYLLDKTKQVIYKYVATDNGFGKKELYNKDDVLTIERPHSLAIDSSVYIGGENRLAKYTAGLPDAFSTEYPEDNITVSKVITSGNLDKIYVWDKSNSALYVLGKNGAYERQIASRVLKDGSDLVVYGSNAYILRGAKIYSMKITD